jgi:hypothetical protein
VRAGFQSDFEFVYTDHHTTVTKKVVSVSLLRFRAPFNNQK